MKRDSRAGVMFCVIGHVPRQFAHDERRECGACVGKHVGHQWAAPMLCHQVQTQEWLTEQHWNDPDVQHLPKPALYTDQRNQGINSDQNPRLFAHCCQLGSRDEIVVTVPARIVHQGFEMAGIGRQA